MCEAVSAEVFSTYKSGLSVGIEHPGDICEAASLSAITLPSSTYNLFDALPPTVVEEGRLSKLQLEGVLYACTVCGPQGRVAAAPAEAAFHAPSRRHAGRHLMLPHTRRRRRLPSTRSTASSSPTASLAPASSLGTGRAAPSLATPPAATRPPQAPQCARARAGGGGQGPAGERHQTGQLRARRAPASPQLQPPGAVPSPTPAAWERDSPPRRVPRP